MEYWERAELMKGRIPKCCPFCFEVSGKVTKTFRLFFAEPWIYEGEQDILKQLNALGELRVVCEICEEEIRKEDVLHAEKLTKVK